MLRRALVLVAIGCGRIGFDVCAGCGGDNRIALVEHHATGLVSSAPSDVPITGAAGDVVVVGMYGQLLVTVSDSQGSTWRSLPQQPLVAACNDSASVRLFYATLAAGGADDIKLAPQGTVQYGSFVLAYSGVDGADPIDDAQGETSTSATTLADAGTLHATGNDAVAAVFLVISLVGSFQPGAGFEAIANDGAAAAFVEIQNVGPGAITPTATLPGGASSACWIGSSVALRPR